MNEIRLSLSMPLDDDGYFRRECPLCCKEFKVLLEHDEMIDLAQHGVESYLLEEPDGTATDKSQDEETQYTCPYCGQKASSDDWWTQEQLAYLHVICHNIVAQSLNEHFIRPMRRMSNKYVKFKGYDMQQQEPWMSPEVNDMTIFELPCCERKIKIADEWTKEIHCFFCGFPHPQVSP